MSKKMGTQNKQMLRKAMWDKSKRCFYCGIVTELPKPFPMQTIAHNTATIEHLFDSRKHRVISNKYVVLSCYKCNNAKATAKNNGTTFYMKPEVEATVKKLEILYRNDIKAKKL